MLRQIIDENQLTQEQLDEITSASVLGFNGLNLVGNANVDPRILRLFIAAGPKHYITRAEMEEYRTNLEIKYHVYLPNGTEKTDWQPDIVVSWPAFRDLATMKPVPPAPAPVPIPDPDSLALRFIHCYDAGTNTWFLTLQRMRIIFPNPPAFPPPGTPCNLEAIDIVDDLTSIFQRKTGMGIVSPAQGGTDGEPLFYDEKYFAKVKDDRMGDIDKDKHARSITFSWKEIEKLFNENSKGRPADEFDIVFFSLSYDMGINPPPNESKVQFPHSLAMYMRWQGDDCLDNLSVVLVGAAGKASDLGGICPPRDNNIVWQL